MSRCNKHCNKPMASPANELDSDGASSRRVAECHLLADRLLYHVIDPNVTVSMWVVATLLSLIGALLAVDIGSDALPSQITIGLSNSGDNNDE